MFHICLHDPGCLLLSADDYSDLPYCQKHRSIGNLFISRDGNLKAWDFEFSSKFTTQLSNILKKRYIKFIHCEILFEKIQSWVSTHIVDLIFRSYYDLITDYLYNDAKGGDISDLFFFFSLPPIFPFKNSRLTTPFTAIF